MPVRIYQIDRAFSEWIWLCDDHIKRRRAQNYLVKAEKDPPHDELRCTDCFYSVPIDIDEQKRS